MVAVSKKKKKKLSVSFLAKVLKCAKKTKSKNKTKKQPSCGPFVKSAVITLDLTETFSFQPDWGPTYSKCFYSKQMMM